VLRTLDLYFRLISVRIRGQLQYRWSVLFDIFSTAFIILIEFGSIALIFDRFKSIGGWQLAEIAFLYGNINMAFGVMDMLFSGFDPQNFGRQMRKGAFDQLLLRPVNITVQVFGSEFILRRIGRIVQGAAITGFALSQLQVHWTLLKLLFLPLAFASMVCFFGGLFVIGATIAFWTVESLEVINIFTYGGTELMSYPMHIYQDWMRYFFTFIIPAAFINYYPTLFLLDKPDPFSMPAWAPWLSPAVGLGVLLVALSFWQFGIRHYQSTGT
jgi:ABC-2 type transport system permease protein